MYDQLEMYAPERERGPRDPWPEHVAVTTLEEIRYAEQLRLRIRESYLRRRDLPPPICMMDVDGR